MRVCMFEDRGVADLEPLTLTRPAFDLLCGMTSLCSKQCRHFGTGEVGALVRPHLADLCGLQQAHAHVNDLAWLRADTTVLVNSRWLPPSEPAVDIAEPGVALVGDEVAYAVVGPEQLAHCAPNTIDDCLATWKNVLAARPAEGRLLRYAWDLVRHNPEQLHLDFQQRPWGHHAGWPPSSFSVVGPTDDLLLDPTAQLDPMVLADTRHGPVIIDRGAVVTAFSRLEGPCYIGPGTHVLGAKVRAGTTIGPNCRIGGEIECSIVQGHSNKYHDGFLGHSYVGEWVNLGAGTCNSDLRNDYGEVTVTVNGRRVPTGLTKVGCFLGDHTKTGLGTLLNTGTNAGVFCNLLPAGGLLPKYLPSFCSYWNGALVDHADLHRLLQTASEVMQRRDRALTEVHAALFRLLYDQTAAERRRALREAEGRRLRRSA